MLFRSKRGGLDGYIRYFCPETVSFSDYFPQGDCVVYLDEPGRLKERGETIELEFRESMVHRLEKGYLLPGQTELLYPAGVIRTVTAVERADVVVVMIDASEGVTEQDAKIAGIAHEKGKGVIIAVNKWDAIEKNDKTIYKHTNRIREVLSFMPYAEIVFISARTGLRISRMFETLDAVIELSLIHIFW